jgi:hypothetical protein
MGNTMKSVNTHNKHSEPPNWKMKGLWVMSANVSGYAMFGRCKIAPQGTPAKYG